MMFVLVWKVRLLAPISFVCPLQRGIDTFYVDPSLRPMERSVLRSLSIACRARRVGASSCFSGFGAIEAIRLKTM